jgi:LPXTG-motif cell wall-anchored protein
MTIPANHRRGLRATAIGLSSILLFAGPSAASARQAPSALIEIPNSGAFGFFNARVTETRIDEFGEVHLAMDWAVPAGTVAGDTIRIVLPPALNELSFQAFKVLDTTGLDLGLASLDRSDPANPALVFTFNANVQLGSAGAHGTASFALSLDRSQLEFVDGVVDVQIFNDTVTVTENPSADSTIPKKTVNWRPNQVDATALDSDGRLIQTERHMGYAVYLPIDTAAASDDDWTTVSFTEPPLNGFRSHCTNFGPNQLNGFQVQVQTAGGFTVVPIPSPTELQLTSVVCNADRSITVTAVKPAADTGRYYRIFYNADLLTDDLGRPIYEDTPGHFVVGFPAEYRNDAFVTAGARTFEVSTRVAAQSGEAIGVLVNLPDVDIEKFSASSWEGVQFVAGVPQLTGGDDPQPVNQPAEDFDTAPGKELVGTQAQTVRFRITNIGTEPLTQILITDATLGGAAIGAIDCDFSQFGGPATGPSGGAAVLPPEAGFDCAATLPALGDGAAHADLATVTAVGAGSGIQVTDADAWNAFTAAATGMTTTTTVAPTPTTTTTTPAVLPPGPTTTVTASGAQLPATGGHTQSTMSLALLALAGGAGLVLVARRRSP